jgi:hypothetical protein
MNSGFIRCRVHLLLLVLLALGTSPVAQAQGRFAFVVGNDAYDGLEPLKKAVNDAVPSRRLCAKSASRSRWAKT